MTVATSYVATVQSVVTVRDSSFLQKILVIYHWTVCEIPWRVMAKCIVQIPQLTNSNCRLLLLGELL